MTLKGAVHPEIRIYVNIYSPNSNEINFCNTFMEFYGCFCPFCSLRLRYKSLFPQLSDAWWVGEILAHVELQITASWSDCSSKRKRWIFHCVSQMKETLADMLLNSSPSDGDTALLFVLCSHRPVTHFSASDGESNEISYHISCEFGRVI